MKGEVYSGNVCPVHWHSEGCLKRIGLEVRAFGTWCIYNGTGMIGMKRSKTGYGTIPRIEMVEMLFFNDLEHEESSVASGRDIRRGDDFYV